MIFLESIYCTVSLRIKDGTQFRFGLVSMPSNSANSKLWNLYADWKIKVEKLMDGNVKHRKQNKSIN